MVVFMDYIFKKYYKKENYKKIYRDRLDFEESLKLDFKVKGYPLYYVFNSYSINLMDRIRILDNKIDNLFRTLPEVARFSFLDDIIVEEIFSSNEIEGVRSTKEEILLTRRHLEENKKSKLRFASIINSYIKLNEYDKVNSLEDIRKHYDEVVEGEIDVNSLPDSNLFRQEDVFIQSNKSFDGSFIHKGISPDSLNLYLEKWINFMNSNELHLLIRVAIGHYIFEYIHPFYDGNGRLGRFISSMYINNSYSYLTSMAVSRGALIKKNDYYKAFKQTSEQFNMGELNYFVDEFLKIIIKAQEDMRDSLRSNIVKLDNTVDFLESKFDFENEAFNVILILVQDYIFSSGVGITREDILGELNAVSLNNRTRNLRCFSQLEDEGYITRIKGRPIVYKLSDKMINFISKEI